jgi:hypothetical protein
LKAVAVIIHSFFTPINMSLLVISPPSTPLMSSAVPSVEMVADIPALELSPSASDEQERKRKRMDNDDFAKLSMSSRREPSDVRKSKQLALLLLYMF